MSDTAWSATFDQLISFRRSLKQNFGIPVRAEVKANYLLHNGGAFRSLALSERSRRNVYLSHLRIIPKLGLLAFAVVTDKVGAQQKYPNRDARDISWERVLQRLERFSTVSHQTPVFLVHDEGEDALVRKYARHARRAGSAGSMYGTGLLKLPARELLDDPVSRRSHESYFLQLADLAAFAAFRRHFPPPIVPGRLSVVPSNAWDKIGAGVYWQATMYAKSGFRGIVFGP